MDTLIHRRVEMARRSENPFAVCRMPSGWAILGDSQFLPGYALLLADPVVADLNALEAEERRQYLWDMTLIGDALLEVMTAYRINYETLGNAEPALHTHIFPRYFYEPDEYRRGPVFFYPQEQRNSRPFDAERDGELIQALRQAIERRLDPTA